MARWQADRQHQETIMSLGLDDVVAAETALSHVDGEAGRLIVRGFDLEDIANLSFEALCSLLWDGLAPGQLGESAVQAALGAARLRAYAIGGPLLPQTAGLAPVEALRLLLSALADGETTPHHLMAVAAVPVFAAMVVRYRKGLKPVAPEASAGHVADFLAMVRGTKPSVQHTRALETYIVTVADHGLNASTFTARVIASTRAGMFSAVVGALCALKGPLHGGAPGPVLDMLDEIGHAANIEPWLEAAIARGDRLMGFGHRVYRVRDPRAEVLKRVAVELRGQSNRLHFAEAIEAAALRLLATRKTTRRLETNVEFYTALVLEALELPREAFTAVFAVGRVLGWTAHILEQEAGGRIIRPQSRYVGPMPKKAA
jgi:citrate synthase